MQRSIMRRFLAPIAALLALSGCILVDDFAPAWEKATPDRCIASIAQSLYAAEFRRSPEGKAMDAHARVLDLGTFHFLMLKQDVADKGGRMYRFDVSNGIFRRYRLNPAMRPTFTRDYPDAPVSLAHDMVRLAQLAPRQRDLLAEIAAKADYWEIEDQTLYNPLRNPACRYDDRPSHPNPAKGTP